MDRKNKIWLMALLCVIFALIAGLITLSGRLGQSRREAAELNAQLVAQQEAAAALQEQLENAGIEFSSLTAELEQTRTTADSHRLTAETAAADLAALQEHLANTTAEQEQALTAATESAQVLQTQLEASQEDVARLEAQVEQLNTQSDEDAALREQLEAQLAEEEARVDQLQTELANVAEICAAHVDELQSYQLSPSLDEGDAHSATSVSETIRVSANGMTGSWHYANRTESGNTVQLRLMMEDDVLYLSEPIAPGESMDTITLSKEMPVGEYRITAVTAIGDGQGNDLFAYRVPVTLIVED